MKKLLLLITVVTLTSCASTNQVVGYTSQKVSIPDVNTVQKKQIGETLTKYEILSSKPAILIDNVPEVKFFGTKIPYQKDDVIPLQVIKKGSKIYYNESYRYGSFNNYYGVEVYNDEKQTKYVVMTDEKGSISNTKLTPELLISEATYTKVGEGYYKQEFIYNGNVSNNIKFIYREYINDTARPAFTQELQYDLNESNIVGFKEMRIEIIKATNTGIEYKVLNHLKN